MFVMDIQIIMNCYRIGPLPFTAEYLGPALGEGSEFERTCASKIDFQTIFVT